MNAECPKELKELMAEWMIEHGPDGHCDGHEKIAELAWQWMRAQLEHQED